MQAADIGLRPFDVKLDNFLALVSALATGIAFQLFYTFLKVGYSVLNPFAPFSVFHLVLLDFLIKAFILINRLVLRGAVAAHHSHYCVCVHISGFRK
jgi:uncharacterized membrane protein